MFPLKTRNNKAIRGEILDNEDCCVYRAYYFCFSHAPVGSDFTFEDPIRIWITTSLNLFDLFTAPGKIIFDF